MTSKPNLVTLLPDLSNYTDWEDMMTCYMRASECYLAVDPEDKIEQEYKKWRDQAAEGDTKQIALNKMKELKANSEALSIIRQWIDVSHRPKIRKCSQASEAWRLLRPMRNALTADVLTGKFHDLKVEDFDKATDAMNALQVILNEIYATSEEAEIEFPQAVAVRMAVSKLPTESYKQFKYDCFKEKGMPKTMTELILRLTELEQWSNMDSENQGESRSAFWINKTGDKTGQHNSFRGGRRRGRPRSNITCWNCGKKGHFQYECDNTNKKDNKKGTFDIGLNAWNNSKSSDDDGAIQEVYWCNPKKSRGTKQAHFAFSAHDVTPIFGYTTDDHDSDSGNRADEDSDCEEDDLMTNSHRQRTTNQNEENHGCNRGKFYRVANHPYSICSGSKHNETRDERYVLREDESVHDAVTFIYENEDSFGREDCLPEMVTSSSDTEDTLDFTDNAMT